MKVGLVDYGLGNLGSVINMLRRVGAEVHRVNSPDDLLASDRLLLPGIGSFDHGMSLLHELELVGPLRAHAAARKPLMGICLGMQLLFDASEEGERDGLSLLPGRSVRFDEDLGVRIPHMGWSQAVPLREDPLIAGLEPDSRFYFVHSYHVVPERSSDTLATTPYGSTFTSMVRSGSVMGAQFHPEKSHTFGMTILRNFASL